MSSRRHACTINFASRNLSTGQRQGEGMAGGSSSAARLHKIPRPWPGYFIRTASLVIAACLLSLPVRVQAEPVGSPAGILKKGKWVMALVGSIVPSRDLKGDAQAAMYQGGHFRGYGLTDWLSIYGKIGAAYLEVDDPSIKKTQDPTSTNSFHGNLLASVQVKSRLLHTKDDEWELDGSFQYVDIRAHHKDKNEARWHEWQFATSVAKSFNRIKPYVGAKYSLLSMFYRVRENGTLIKQSRYKQDTPVGFFVGTDVYLGQREDVVLNVESAYLNGPEISVAIAYTF